MTNSDRLMYVANKVSRKNAAIANKLIILAQALNSEANQPIPFATTENSAPTNLNTSMPEYYNNQIKDYVDHKEAAPTESHQVSFTFSVPKGTKPDFIKGLLEGQLNMEALENEHNILFEKSTVSVKRPTR